MKKRNWFLFVFALYSVIVIIVNAQSNTTIPDVCDLTDQPAPTRFYQRGDAPDDTTDDSDFWSYATMSVQRINPNIISQGLAQLDESSTRQSFLLIRNRQIVYEEYYNGSSITDSNNVASVSKSILSALIGIAIGVEVRGLHQVGIAIKHAPNTAQTVIAKVIPAIGVVLLPDDIQTEQVVGVIIRCEFPQNLRQATRQVKQVIRRIVVEHIRLRDVIPKAVVFI